MSILDEPKYTMAEAARRVGVHVATIFRWKLKGVRGHKLPTVVIGGRRYVLQKDLDAFLAALNEHRIGDDDDAERRANEAGKQLDARGV